MAHIPTVKDWFDEHVIIDASSQELADKIKKKLLADITIPKRKYYDNIEGDENVRPENYYK